MDIILKNLDLTARFTLLVLTVFFVLYELLWIVLYHSYKRDKKLYVRKKDAYTSEYFDFGGGKMLTYSERKVRLSEIKAALETDHGHKFEMRKSWRFTDNKYTIHKIDDESFDLLSTKFFL